LMAKRRGDKFKLWERVGSTEWKPGGWATEAAALAARAQFKQWVDYERNVQQRAAQARSAASRSSSALEALLRPPEPTRATARKRPRGTRIAVSLNAVSGNVQLGLMCVELMAEGSPGPEEIVQYHHRTLSRDRTLSLPHVLQSCWDFAHEKTALQELVESCGHVLRMGVKGHPEMAGKGIEYCWGKSKQKFRRDVNDRVQAHLHANIIKCFSRSDAFLPLARIRKFARKTRAYRRAYRDGKPNSLADVERLIKVYKSHRSAEVFDKKFCHE
jgi:hypothetical protein